MLPNVLCWLFISDSYSWILEWTPWGYAKSLLWKGLNPQMIVSKEMLKLMGWCIKLDRAEVAVAISLVLNSNFSCTYQNLSELNHILICSRKPGNYKSTNSLQTDWTNSNRHWSMDFAVRAYFALIETLFMLSVCIKQRKNLHCGRKRYFSAYI